MAPLDEHGVSGHPIYATELIDQNHTGGRQPDRQLHFEWSALGLGRNGAGSPYNLGPLSAKFFHVQTPIQV
jgi:hypothetical protein